MAKMYFSQIKDQLTMSNWPISENGAITYHFEVNEADLKAYHEGTLDFLIENGELKTTESTRKVEAEQLEQKKLEDEILKKQNKLALIQKITSGTATEEEQQEFANLI